MIRQILEAVEQRGAEIQSEADAHRVPSVDDLVLTQSDNIPPEDTVFGASYDSGGEEVAEAEWTAKRDVELSKVHGGLSQTAKMPCPSYSLSPGEGCPRGKILAIREPGSTCRFCYGKVGRSATGASAVSRANRTQLIRELMRDGGMRNDFIEAMVEQLEREDNEYFRWHDTGDVMGSKYLDTIVAIAEGTPGVQHWLPTREGPMMHRWMMKHGNFPKNLIVRVSADMINQIQKPPTGLVGSTVDMMEAPAGVYKCPATWDEKHREKYKHKCGSCRACWDPKVKQVSYRYHGGQTSHGRELPPDLMQQYLERPDVK